MCYFKALEEIQSIGQLPPCPRSIFFSPSAWPSSLELTVEEKKKCFLFVAPATIESLGEYKKGLKVPFLVSAEAENYSNLKLLVIWALKLLKYL